MGRNERSVYMARQTTDLLYAVVHRNAEVAWRAMKNIDEAYGGEGVFNACRAIAEMTRTTIYPGIPRGDGTLSGAFLTVQPRPARNLDPKHVWAAQFFVAHVNGDDETCGALFLATIDEPRTHAAQVVTLVNMCAGLIREAVEVAEDE